jgi:3-(3-hydroxy-phenyl)propionate hydroxylase
VDETSRFDDFADGRFAVVTSTTPTPVQQSEIERRGAVVVTAAPGTDLHRWLRRSRARAVIVRPDATVQRAGRDVAALIADLLPMRAPSRPTRTRTTPASAAPAPTTAGTTEAVITEQAGAHAKARGSAGTPAGS